MLPYIIHNFINKKDNLLTLKAFDSVEENSFLNNELFFGSPGLLTLNAENFRFMHTISYLNYKIKERIQQGDGYIITRQDEDIQVFLYSYSDELKTLIKA